nr:hypothetical protein OG461_09100 [Streptomyces sp. NBC_00995]
MPFARTAARVLCAAALFLGTACSLVAQEEMPPVAEGDMTGHWTGTCGATIDFAAGGTYESRDFPVEGEAGGKPPRTTGKGEWTLLDRVEGVAPKVILEGEKDFQSLTLVKHGAGFELHQWVGDPDDGNGCTYRR